MKVRLLVARAGVGFVQQAGEVIEISSDEAKRMIEAGQAEPLAQKRSERDVEKRGHA